MHLLIVVTALVGLTSPITAAIVPKDDDLSSTIIDLSGQNGPSTNDTKGQPDEDIMIGCTGHGLDPQPLADLASEYCAYYHDTVPAHKGHRLSRGGVSFYECNYADYAQPCDNDEMSYAIKQIRDTCGMAMSGWWFHREWNKNYGFDNDAAAICSNLKQNNSTSKRATDEKTPAVAHE